MPEDLNTSFPDISRLRVEYRQRSLSEDQVDPNPFKQFSIWIGEAIAAHVNEPNAMTVATSTPAGIPSARIILLKGVNDDGFVFYTNYLSRKGGELAENPKAALVFFWPELERQVRIEGTVSKTSDDESDTYFHLRPPAAQIGSAASPQSQVVASRQVLEDWASQLEHAHPDGIIPRPAHWGGYRLSPSRLEFWQGGPSRLHDRLEYVLNGEGKWIIRRLAP